MAQLTLLNEHDDIFPPVTNALENPNGLLAVGGLLTTSRLENAYRQGIFPWYSEGDPVMWWSPNPRCVFKTKTFHKSRSFSRFIKKRPFKITINNAFERVVTSCALPRPYQEETWINQDIINAYTALHNRGLAHSVEVWQNDKLVGGIYGVFVANTYCGESMFSQVSNASKTALYALSGWLKNQGVIYIDCQITNPHLMSLGAVEIERTEFISHLNNNEQKLTPIDWSPKEIDYE